MMPVRVLSLERTPWRLELFRERNSHVRAEVQWAVDGQTVDRSSFPGLAHSDGALGCMLSHLEFWDAVIEAGHPMTIFEDDAIIHNDFNGASRDAIDELPADWHICLWGFNFDAMAMFELTPGVPFLVQGEQNLLRENAHRFPAAGIVPNPLKLYRSWGTVGYAISPAGAKYLREQPLITQPCQMRFTELTRELVVNNIGIDVAMNAFYPMMNAFVCIPPLVITKNEDSTVAVP